jgi:hypothetical protein
MPRPPKQKPNALVEGAEKAAATLAGFDYNVDPEDFVFYELHRLIEEDRCSFENAEFRRLIDEGIRAHIEGDVVVRARLAGILRNATMTGDAYTVAMRVVHALEDVQTDLCNVAVLVRNYTAYLLSKLDTLESDSTSERITSAADLLFESAGDRDAASTALDILCGAASPVCARVLAHAVSEPLLDEDLEARAYAALKSSWPLPRHYLLYNLRDHPHEDIPIRWFQLFIEVDEPETVELVLEELRAHGESPRYQEDLATLMEVLQGCRDPEIEDKILDAINSPSANSRARALLQKFLEEHRPFAPEAPTPWTSREQAAVLNRQYIAAAALWDSGRKTEALQALDKILAIDPSYPFALTLKQAGFKA